MSFDLNPDWSVQWKELTVASDETCKIKCKKSKANLLIQHGSQQILINELDSKALEILYHSLEIIQRELDDIQKVK